MRDHLPSRTFGRAATQANYWRPQKPHRRPRWSLGIKRNAVRRQSLLASLCLHLSGRVIQTLWVAFGLAFTGTGGHSMSKQKYHIGELVCVGAASYSGPSAMNVFRVTNTYFIKDRARVYRLRQIDAPNEQVVPESELSRA